jgi:hypothetical protein
VAWDADGTRLDARLERGGATRITILVEDQGAKYPIVVDPTFTRAAKLVGDDGSDAVAASGTHSGLAVAIEGDRLVVGSWGSESVFVFERIAGSWELSQRLVASDTRPLDQLGAAVALSGDRILAGAPRADGVSGTDEGAVYVFSLQEGRWVEEAKITPADPQRGSLFGSAVAIDRDTAVIGNQANPLGGAYVFVRVGAAWLEEQKLPRPGNAALMGWAVAVQGDTAVIGAPGTSLPLTLPGQQGAAYVFRRAGALWELEAALLPSAPEGLGWFGAAVSLDVDQCIVGAYVAPGGERPGAAYVFTRNGSAWSEEQRLVPATSQVNDRFSWKVAIRGDSAMAASLPHDGRGKFEAVGSGHVFTRTGGFWSEVDQLDAQDAERDSFGIALAFDGSTAVVGASEADPMGFTDAGAVFLFGSLGGVWSQTGTLLTGGAPIGDDMGWSVAVDRSTAMVAAPRDDHAGGVDAGAVYMFERSGGSWEARQKLTASDAQVGQNFGTAVAIQGDLAVIGAIGDDHSGFVDAGSAYVFRRQDGQWIEGQKLVAGAPEDNPGFGASVAISGQTVLVGASNADLGALIDAGAVYVFENTGGVWSEHQVLEALDAKNLAVFGTSVALDGDTALVGARGDDAGVGAAAGAAYFFTREQGVWSQHQKVTASDAEPGDTFGIVALEGATAVISSLFESPGGVFRAGSAYVFELHGSEWTEVAKLEASDKAEEDRFGRSLALAGDTLLVGRLPFRGPRFDDGGAYVFSRSGGVWIQEQLLVAQGPGEEGFGVSLALDAETALVGALFAEAHGYFGSGAAFAYEMPRPDDDLDGVANDIEDGAPNGGDGNGDGIPDSAQADVASLPNAVDGRYVTLVAEPGTQLVGVSASSDPSSEDLPVGVEFPVGFVEFEVSGLAPGASTLVAMLLPPGVSASSYWKFGPNDLLVDPHWYEFLYDGVSGAIIEPGVVSLHFVDGGRGDQNVLTTDGTIVDPGGPATEVPGTDNAAPVVNAGPGALLVDLATFSSAGGFSDPDADSWTATVDYGDGTGTQALALVGQAFSLAHDYSDKGVFTVTVCVSDGTVQVCDTATVTMELSTAVSLDAPQVQYSDSVRFRATLTDSLGRSVPGATLDFSSSLAGCAGSATTGANGAATLDCGPTDAPGAETVSTSYAGGLPLLRASSDSASFDVATENATASYDGDNPAAIQVASDGGASPAFDLVVHVQETVPDTANPDALAAAGDIANAVVEVTLQPVGPGSPVSTTCSPTGVSGAGYSAVLTVSCPFTGVDVNTYSVGVAVNSSGYYVGGTEDVLTIFDPSLGFTTGGGFFYWPGTEDPSSGYPGHKTNFGFTIEYNKKRTTVKGSLLLIRHLPDGTSTGSGATRSTAGDPGCRGGRRDLRRRFVQRQGDLPAAGLGRCRGQPLLRRLRRGQGRARQGRRPALDPGLRQGRSRHTRDVDG